MGGFFSQDNPPPLEQAEGGTPPGNVVVQEPTGVDGATSSFFGRGPSPQIQAFEEEAKQAAEAAAASAEEAEDAATAAAGSAQNALNTASGIETSVAVAVASKNEAQASAALAEQAVTTTQNSAAAAATSAGQAATSATNAQNSASGAANSSSQAASSAQNAAASAGAAASSANNIQTAANTATTKAVEAATSATQAASSATAAAGSANTATTKAGEAATSATNAAGSATTASTAAATATTESEEAATSATNAAGSATAAAGSATGAAGSATTATTKASEAASSATAAAGSATTATTKASEAATSATSAAGSATSAAGSAVAADTSADQALASADAAAGSATSAGTSASNAAGSATNAAGSATTATTKAAEAATSATAASTSAGNAAASATTATTKAAEASTSAAAASGSASSASTSASTATTKAAEASTSASNAATSATASGTSATNAATSATAAGTSATNASNSAAAAAGSASNANIALAATEDARDDAYVYRDDAALAAQSAASARDATLAAFDSFDDRYLGVKTSNPSVDNDGNALVAGALYFNSTAGEMRVYTGTAWAAAYVSGAGVLLIANNLSDVANAASARTNLGLATVAASGAYADLTGRPTAVSAFSNDAGYLTSFTEADPTVPSHVKAITTTKISNWDTAFGWGNHASAGYLIGITSGQVTTALGYTPYDAANPAGYITGITSGNVTTALGYTPANRAGDTFTGPITVNSGANQVILGSDGAIELTRGAGGAYFDFKNSTAEDFDVRLQASGNQLNISAAGGLTLNGAGVLTGITAGQVTTALGYTPYNATNPAGYITSSALSAYLPLAGGTMTGDIGIAAGKKLAYSATAYITPENNVTGAEISTSGSITFKAGSSTPERLTINASGNVTAAVDVRAPIFYDSNNTAYYVDPNSNSVLYKFENINQRVAYDRGWGNYPSITVYNTTDQGPQNDFRIHGIGGANGGDFAVRLLVDGDITSLVNINAGGAFYGQGFYDSNDTGYYVDPASTSRLNQINYTAMYNAANTDYGIVGNNGFFDTVNSGVDADALELCYVRGSEVRIGTSGGNKAIRASLFYKGTNTAYYVDPEGTSNLSRISSYIAARDANANWNTGFTNTPAYSYNYHGDLNGGTNAPRAGWWFYESMRHSNASNYWGTQIAWGWEDNANELWQRNVSGGGFSGWVRYLNSGNYNSFCNFSTNSVYGGIYYDGSDSSTYIDPNGISWIKGNFNIARVSPLGDNDCFGGLELREVSLVANTQTAATYSPRVNFHWGSIAAATIFMNSGGNFVFGGQGDITNNRRSIFCNELYATGNVTAYYSDDRLKTRIGNIENALDIVSSLNGFRYVDNDLAKTFGYTNENGQIGVSAQEVQKHLPEIVRPAAFDVDHDDPRHGSKSGENYLTVDYSRLVPLLIEAVKELRDEVETLKGKSQ